MILKQGRISDFSTVAEKYDQTRHIPEQILLDCYGFLQQHNFIPQEGLALDVGCGTGQISIPLLKKGFTIAGIDVSSEMIARAKSKSVSFSLADYQVGDARALKYNDSTFDFVIFSKLLMHIEDWKLACREFVRVTKPGTSIIQVYDRGFFANSVRREFSRRADELGFLDRFPGTLSSSGEVSKYMKSLGCGIHVLRPNNLSWSHRITRREALSGFEERLFAEFWYIPDSVYENILLETHEWAVGQSGGLDETEHLQPYLVIEIYETGTTNLIEPLGDAQ